MHSVQGSVGLCLIFIEDGLLPGAWLFFNLLYIFEQRLAISNKPRSKFRLLVFLIIFISIYELYVFLQETNLLKNLLKYNLLVFR